MAGWDSRAGSSGCRRPRCSDLCGSAASAAGDPAPQQGCQFPRAAEPQPARPLAVNQLSRGAADAVRARYEPSDSDSFQPLSLWAAFQLKMRRFVVSPTGLPQPQIKKHKYTRLFFFSLTRFTFLLLLLRTGGNLLLILYNGNIHQFAAPKSILRPNSWESAEVVSERAVAADRLPAALGRSTEIALRLPMPLW